MGAVRSLWFRELQRYPVERVEQALGPGGRQTAERLVQANILRRVARGQGDPDISELLEVAPAGEPMFVFNFCGLVLAGGCLIHVYPKYLPVDTRPREAFWLAMRAVQRYEHHRRQHLSLADRRAEGGDFLATVLALLADYRMHGLYRVADEEIEINGQGDTDWQRTLERYQPAFIRTPQGRRPLYMERETVRRRTDEENFFRLVQMACLNGCAELVRTLELTSLVNVQGVRFPGVKAPASRHYMLRRLRQELGRQFSEQRRTVLRLLILYLEQGGGHAQAGRVVFYGTNAMEAVWEEAVREVFSDRLHTRIGDIAVLPEAKRAACPYRQKQLIDIIGRPSWTPCGGQGIAVDTLIPDTVAITEDTFLIYDAKYYTPAVRAGTADRRGSITGQPGLESVTKQYLYQMAYAEFLQDFGLTQVQNVFLLPLRHEEGGPLARPLASVSFPLLEQYTHTPLRAIQVDADALWQAYVEQKHIDVRELAWEELAEEHTS